MCKLFNCTSQIANIKYVRVKVVKNELRNKEQIVQWNAKKTIANPNGFIYRNNCNKQNAASKPEYYLVLQ